LAQFSVIQTHLSHRFVPCRGLPRPTLERVLSAAFLNKYLRDAPIQSMSALGQKQTFNNRHLDVRFRGQSEPFSALAFKSAFDPKQTFIVRSR